MREWAYRSTYSGPRHQWEVSGQPEMITIYLLGLVARGSYLRTRCKSKNYSLNENKLYSKFVPLYFVVNMENLLYMKVTHNFCKTIFFVKEFSKKVKK
jgi:hypothetical protein